MYATFSAAASTDGAKEGAWMMVTVMDGTERGLL